MPRAPPAAERERSQRQTAEFRALEAENAELKRKLDTADREMREAQEYGTQWKKKYNELHARLVDANLTDVDDLAEKIPKLKPQSSAYYFTTT